MKRLFLYPVLAALAMVCFVGSVFAADAVTPSTTIDAGWFVQFLVSYIMPTLGLIISLGLGRLYVVLQAKWKIDIDATQREALQTALTQAAGLLIAKGAHMADGKTIDVGNPLIAQAVKYVQDNANAALTHFALGPDDIAQKIVAKIGALGAAPAAIVASPAAPAAA